VSVRAADVTNPDRIDGGRFGVDFSPRLADAET
jgi:hypothetical protein